MKLKILKKMYMNIEKFYEDKNELMNQNDLMLKDIDSMKNKLSLKDIQLLNIQKEINKMDLNNKKLEDINIFIINENTQLKNEIKDLEEKIYELQKLIKTRENEFLQEKNEYKEEIKLLKTDNNKYKILAETKEKEKIKIQKKIKHIMDEKKLLLDKIILMQEENEFYIGTIKNKK